MSKISFCINTAKNELNHIKLLFQSLEKNLSTLQHEIIVFIDSDNQGTFDWLLTQKKVFPFLKILKNDLPICYGYARNINEMFLQASNQIVSYLQSDMVICKNYDLELLHRIQPKMVLCSTRIEPPLHGNSGEKITWDFGLDPTKFDLQSFTNYAESQKLDKYTEYFFAPFTMYKDTWNNIGGHDTLFRRSREDSDIFTRLILNNVLIKQTWSALVYHFTCTSSRGLDWFNKNNNQSQYRTKLQQSADIIELNRFIVKWGKFNHSLSKLKYYNIDAYITWDNLNLIDFITIQNHFHKIYVDDVTIIKFVQEVYDKEHSLANQLLNINDEDWIEYNYMYNKMNAFDRIKSIESFKQADVLVKFNLNHITTDIYQEFINNIQSIIDNTDEIGDYEYYPFTLTINNKIDRATDKIIVNNPRIKKEHLYKIF
jgi:hypothetical protein